MNVSYYNTTNSGSNSSANPAALTTFGTVTAGDVLLVQITFTTTSVSVTGITDTVGNTWVLVSADNVSTYRFETWVVLSCGAGATTATVSFSGTPNFRAFMYRISDLTGASIGPIATLNDNTTDSTVTMAPVTLVSGGTAFSLLRTTGSFTDVGPGGAFAQGNNGWNGNSNVQGIFRTEIDGFSAAPSYRFGFSDAAIGESQTVVIYGTSTTTRYYTAVVATGERILGPLNGDWAWCPDDGAFWYKEHSYYEMVRSKYQAGTRSITAIAVNQQGNYDFKIVDFVTPPLAAQSLSGTMQVCFGLNSWWDSGSGIIAASSVVKLKVHAYISTGATTTPRTVLIDNLIETATINQSSSTTQFMSFTTPQAVSGSILAGDRIVIEVGLRVVSSPTPTPTYPPEANTHLSGWFISPNRNANEGYPDARSGDTASFGKAAWIEFSQTTITEVAPTAPANDACADAIEITSLPFQSDWMDVTGSTDTDKAVWYRWTAPSTGLVALTSLGSNYLVSFNLYTGSCGALVFYNGGGWSDTNFVSLRNLGYWTGEVIEGQEYFIRVSQEEITSGNASTATNQGGALRFNMFYIDETPVADDVYLNAGWLAGFRGGQLVRFNPFFRDTVPTGITIDYTRRELLNIEDDSIDTNYRIYSANHVYSGVEVFNLGTLCLNTSEIDFQYNWGVGVHPAQVYLTRAGILYVGWWGNGYLYVAGFGTLPAYFNSVASDPPISALQSIDSDWLEDQPDYDPGIDIPTSYLPEAGVGAPWAFTIDENTNIMYYTTGGLYFPLASGTDIIRRFDITNNVQLADFATVTLEGDHNNGLRGLRVLFDGGVIVANGSVVTRLNSSGVFVRNYIPSNADEHQDTIDVELTADGLHFWMYDLQSTRMTQFELSSGDEITSFQPYLQIATSTQIAVFTPEIPNPFTAGAGIYKITPGKRNDTLWDGVDTVDVKIPNIFGKTGYIGD